MTTIAPSAEVHPQATLADDVEIGPFCVIGPEATIGRGCVLTNNVTLMGRVTLGQYNRLSPNVVIGGEPQSRDRRFSPTGVVIGDHNIIREGATIDRASDGGRGDTLIGGHCTLMAGSHVAHDAWLGDHVTLGGGVKLGGRVHVHDYASLAAGAVVYQHTTIGAYSSVAELSRVQYDVAPFMIADGLPARPRGINRGELYRRDFTIESIEALCEAHRLIYSAKVGIDNVREILRSRNRLLPVVNHLLTFIQDQQEGRHGRARERRRAA